MKKQRSDIKKTIKKRIEERHKMINKSTLMSEPQKFPKANSSSVSLSNSRIKTLQRIGMMKSITKPRKKINVIISAYRAVNFIEECLDSIQNQTYKCEKILVGVDGCINTLNKVIEIGDKYPNLEIYFSAKNKGPYQMFNALMELIPDDEYIQRFDADDVMNSDMLDQMAIYDVPVVSRNDGILFVKKEILKKVGGFRAWRCAADSDMIFRLGKALNVNKIARAPQFFFRREHDGQLTKLNKTNLKSKLRKYYIGIYQENKSSPNPDIYIEPIKSDIVKIIIKKNENFI